MKLKNQGQKLGGLLFLLFFLVPAVQAKVTDQSTEVNWYVHINRAMIHANDGHEKHSYFVDNANFSSKAGVTGEKCLDPNFKVGGKVELEFVTADSSLISQLNRVGGNNGTHDGVKIRQVDAWLNGNFGKLSLGHGNMSSWLIVASDLSGTASTVGYTGPWLMGGGMHFHDKANVNRVVEQDPIVRGVFSPYDGLSRQDRIRYETPTFSGFTLSGSIASGDKSAPQNNKYNSDIALRYAGEVRDVKLLGAVSLSRFSKGSETRNRKVFDASFAALHVPTGINAAVNFATNKLGTTTYPAAPGSSSQGVSKTQRFSRIQLGLISDLNEYGSTNFVVDYADTKHAFENNAKGKAYGVGVVQQLKKINSEVYFAARQYKFERSLSNIKYDKMLAAMAGIKISFGGTL